MVKSNKADDLVFACPKCKDHHTITGKWAFTSLCERVNVWRRFDDHVPGCWWQKTSAECAPNYASGNARSRSQLSLWKFFSWARCLVNLHTIYLQQSHTTLSQAQFVFRLSFVPNFRTLASNGCQTAIERKGAVRRFQNDCVR